MKKCVNILVYFGKFNSYFPLFLKSCESNEQFDWLIFTDNHNQYNYPKNIRVIHTTLQEVKTLAEKKLGFAVAMKTPYKLCDYKPSYGLLFEEYIEGYEYWGHCDCDLIFGNLDKILSPIMQEGYDKIFAAGHYTLYKNNKENNRRFMHLHNGVAIYKEAFTTDEIYVFDEDYQEKRKNDNNVHSIFLEANASVYAKDLSMNVAVGKAKFIRSEYRPELREFMKEQYQPRRYYFENGELYSLQAGIGDGELLRRDYLYIHLQSRVMRNKVKFTNGQIYEILADRFINVSVPTTLQALKVSQIGKAYLYDWDVFIAKIKRKILNIFKRNR